MVVTGFGFTFWIEPSLFDRIDAGVPHRAVSPTLTREPSRVYPVPLKAQTASPALGDDS